MKNLLLLLFASLNVLVTSESLHSHRLHQASPPPTVRQGDVTYHLYLRSSPNLQLPINNICKICPVKFVVHGWLEHRNRPWYKYITQEYLKKGNYNVILVDWSKPASALYSTASLHVKEVGNFIGKFIVHLMETYGIPLRNIHIIGHSLGSHVTGHAGKTVFNITGQKVHRITSLDAAGPLFEVIPLFQGLVKEDAEIVDAIHTDGGVFGYRNPYGHVDFFPNGGVAVQPGCPKGIDAISVLDVNRILANVFCSHVRSYVYFIKSINEENYIGTQCDSWELFATGECFNNMKIIMGNGYEHDHNTTGKFFGHALENKNHLKV